jgi:muramoyltetrapeptide carboxypeptidase
MIAPKKHPLIPLRLKPGDTIGIVAPASPFDAGIFQRGIRTLESMGFRAYVPEGLYQKDGYLAGCDEHRAELVNRFFADRDIQAIVCAKGGFGSMRLLPLLDFESIAKNPKIFVGHSDISALLSALYTRCGLVTFHGPVVTTLADAPEETRQALIRALSTDQRLDIKAGNGITLRSGSAQGPVCGGNLTTLCHLVGTPFEPRFAGRILLLEDRGEAPYRIDRMLFQMKLAGCFEGIAGIVLGDFKDCGPMHEIFRIVTGLFKDDRIPILAGFDTGHGRQNLTIPLGIEAVLDADCQMLSFQQAATRG